MRRVAQISIWPLAVIASALGFAFAFERGAAEASLATVPLAVGVLLFGLERIVPRRDGEQAWGDPQAWNDVGHTVLGQGAGNAVGQLLFGLGAVAIATEVSAHFGGNLWPVHWPLWAQVPLLLFVADGLDYGRHRLEHRVSWLWPIHALHHDVDRMNILKSSRGHGLDMVFRTLLCYAPLAMIGTPREVLLTYVAAVSVLGPIAHSNIALRVPAFLDGWLMTPAVHHIHHDRSLERSGSNYANLFPAWDRLFGTFHRPSESEEIEFGMETGHAPPGFLDQMVAPFVEWRRALQRSRRASHVASPEGSA